MAKYAFTAGLWKHANQITAGLWKHAVEPVGGINKDLVVRQCIHVY